MINRLVGIVEISQSQMVFPGNLEEGRQGVFRGSVLPGIQIEAGLSIIVSVEPVLPGLQHGQIPLRHRLKPVAVEAVEQLGAANDHMALGIACKGPDALLREIPDDGAHRHILNRLGVVDRRVRQTGTIHCQSQAVAYLYRRIPFPALGRTGR